MEKSKIPIGMSRRWQKSSAEQLSPASPSRWNSGSFGPRAVCVSGVK